MNQAESLSSKFGCKVIEARRDLVLEAAGGNMKEFIANQHKASEKQVFYLGFVNFLARPEAGPARSHCSR
jgi:hypothetical protein